MTIASRSDKIAPVADDGNLKAAENHASRRRGGGTAGGRKAEVKGTEALKKTDKKLLTTPHGCDNLYRLSKSGRKTADEAEKKKKKVLDKDKQI